MKRIIFAAVDCSCFLFSILYSQQRLLIIGRKLEQILEQVAQVI